MQWENFRPNPARYFIVSFRYTPILGGGTFCPTHLEGGFLAARFVGVDVAIAHFETPNRTLFA